MGDILLFNKKEQYPWILFFVLFYLRYAFLMMYQVMIIPIKSFSKSVAVAEREGIKYW